MKGFLAAYLFDCAEPKDTLVIMSGGDSYMEEWFPFITGIANDEYKVILFHLIKNDIFKGIQAFKRELLY